VLAAWAVLATGAVVLLAAHIVVWAIPRPSFSMHCTDRVQGMAWGRMQPTVLERTPRWRDGGCTTRHGNATAYVDVDPAAGKVTVTGMAPTTGADPTGTAPTFGADATALAGLIPVLTYMHIRPDPSLVPRRFRLLDAVTPWAYMDLTSFYGIDVDNFGGGIVAHASMTSDGATFDVPDITYDASTEVTVYWLAPDDAAEMLKAYDDG
jgi:hypothetical protein